MIGSNLGERMRGVSTHVRFRVRRTRMVGAEAVPVVAVLRGAVRLGTAPSGAKPPLSRCAYEIGQP